ncbi:Ribose import permease protein RbsC [Rubrobacter xylanophilus DSM 9941]|uniref:ABC transporter permease n=1 Tax=Rubrobacter xylanophilus TaxID=49319 RepID=UPI001C641877|nr:ABC transporter permease [Rubrobacter xylanophilus]QYJ14995.1 Ribose import permease protein RbsC [Rubrobacter xylanophilus DSM 9941]
MAQATVSERVREVGFLRRQLTRPELAAIAGAILVFAFFAITAGDQGFLTFGGTISYLQVAAQLGIVAVPVALLMIAGEFDLSVGSMVGAAGIIIAITVTQYGWPLFAGVLLACAVALLVGFFNGYLVIKTGLPSFIVTLAMLFALRGLTIGFSRLITGRTQIGGLSEATQGDVLFPIFAGEVAGIPVSVFWWIGLAVLGTWVLQRTAFGNWIFGSGGDPVAARNVGVPVNRVKIILFMCTALSAALLATIQVMDAGSADVLRGELLELQAIAASVIGGVLLTGGYGSVVGAVFGALIFGMVQQGIFFTGVNTDWFLVFVGVMLLVAVLFNNVIRNRASKG